MKKHLSKLFIIIPLLLVGGAAMAAYTFVGPISGPTANNTDAPLDVSATNQIKNGGLSVATFEARGNAYFDQSTYFSGMIRGGTVANNAPNVSFGSTAAPANVVQTGNMFLSGTYQSDTLKTGGGLKPLCADSAGKFFICP
jgi:hypothetical protein